MLPPIDRGDEQATLPCAALLKFSSVRPTGMLKSRHHIFLPSMALRVFERDSDEDWCGGVVKVPGVRLGRSGVRVSGR